MSRRILITDDHPRATERYAWLFSRFDYEIRVAADGLQALAISREFLPEFVFLDIDMPNFGGFETGKQIRSRAWSNGMVLIAISSNWNDQYEESSREAGFDAHLIKPAPLDTIADLIENFRRINC